MSFKLYSLKVSSVFDLHICSLVIICTKLPLRQLQVSRATSNAAFLHSSTLENWKQTNFFVFRNLESQTSGICSTTVTKGFDGLCNTAFIVGCFQIFIFRSEIRGIVKSARTLNHSGKGVSQYRLTSLYLIAILPSIQRYLNLRSFKRLFQLASMMTYRFK